MIFARGQFHHLRASNCSIIFSLNLYLTTRAGLPTTTAYGGTFFATTLYAPITAPSPIVTPDKIVTCDPIQTSFQLTISPLVLAWPTMFFAKGNSSAYAGNGYVETQSTR